MNELFLLFETKYWEVFLQENQAYLGYSIPILKRDCGNLSDISKDEWLDFHQNIVQKLELIFKEKFGAIMFNWTCLLNNAYKTIPAKPQVHWHFRPRYNSKVIINQEVFEDPNFAHHYDKNVKKVVSKDTLKEIIKKFNE